MITSKCKYKLSEVLFSEVSFKREKTVPEDHTYELRVEIALSKERLPDIAQVHVTIESQPEQPFMMHLVLIGKFEQIETQSEIEEAELFQFMVDTGLPILWAYIDQIVKTSSAQMGMKRLNLNFPAQFTWGEEIEESN